MFDDFKLFIIGGEGAVVKNQDKASSIFNYSTFLWSFNLNL